jgi:hypothetical protein
MIYISCNCNDVTNTDVFKNLNTHTIQKTILFNEPSRTDYLKSHHINSLKIYDDLLDCDFKYAEEIFVFGVQDIMSIGKLLDHCIANLKISFDIYTNNYPRSTVFFDSKKNFISDLSAFSKIVLWPDYWTNHLSHVILPESSIANFNFDRIKEYSFYNFLYSKSVNILELDYD